ncbi:sensor histidine kinase [Streptomyces sp. NPDC015127]|uniref:sensor histidine kinase n=1 Tax=Streptomyces sp. NPDC015127 TaxID=3364939 RepID=UPI0036F660EE
MAGSVLTPAGEQTEATDGIGRAFADALHAGLSRVAGERTTAANTSVALAEHAPAILRRFESRLPAVLDPFDRHDTALRAELTARARTALARATRPVLAPDGPAGSPTGPASAQHAAVTATLLMECALPYLAPGDDASRTAQLLGDAIRRTVPPDAPGTERAADGSTADCCWHERRRILRDLHDQLGFSLATAQHLVEGRGGLGPVREAIRQARERLRSLASSLAESSTPPPLPDAIRQYADEAAPPGVEVTVKTSGSEHIAPDPCRRDLFLTVREALGNSFRHAAAGRVTVCLRFTRHWVHASVQDDGTGFDPEQVLAPGHPHQGMRCMTERTAAAGGRLTVTSTTGAGTRVDIHLPLHPQTQR